MKIDEIKLKLTFELLGVESIALFKYNIKNFNDCETIEEIRDKILNKLIENNLITISINYIEVYTYYKNKQIEYLGE